MSLVVKLDLQVQIKTGIKDMGIIGTRAMEIMETMATTIKAMEDMGDTITRVTTTIMDMVTTAVCHTICRSTSIQT